MIRVAAFEQFGLAHLKLVDRPAEPLQPGTVRLRVKCVSPNYRDLLMVTGKYDPKLRMPLIPCSDGSGEVIEVAADVREFSVGDRVCSTMIPDWQGGDPPPAILKSTLGGPRDGMLAEERVLPAKALIRLPDYLSFEASACLPVAGLTAWSALVTEGRCGPGDKVLLLGTGGVSMMALQIAKALGAQVTITSSSDEKLARARELGADFTLNYRANPSWGKEVLSLHPGGVDMVLEVGGDGTFDQSVRATRFGGKLLLIGVLASAGHSVNLTPIIMKRLRIQGILVGSYDEFRQYMTFLEQNQMVPVIDEVFEGLESTGRLFETMARGSHFGKLVLRI